MVNWKVRILNKNFWLAIIPAVILLAQAVLAVFGVTINFGETGEKLIAMVNAAFVVLAILGIVTDPTTEGMGDSIRAMRYDKPKPAGTDDKVEYAFTWETLRDESKKLLPSEQNKLLLELLAIRNAREAANTSAEKGNSR